MAKEFLNLLTKDFKIQFLEMITKIENASSLEEIKDTLAALNMEIAHVEGGASFIGLEIAKKMLERAALFNDGHIKLDAIDNEAKSKIVSLNKRVIEELYFLKVYFELSLSEKPYWEVADRQKAFLSIVESAA